MTVSPDHFAQSLARLREDPQAVARQAAAAGTRVLGYVGDGVPVALLLAALALPVRLRARAGGDVSRVADFLESSFPMEHRLIANQWMAGELDHLEAVVFARSDDAGQRLYYYLCELQRRGLCAGPRPLLFDGASLSRAASFEHTLAAASLLGAELGTVAEALPPARRRVAQREQLLGLARAERLQTTPLPGSAVWALEYASGCDWRDNFNDAARDWLAVAPRLPRARRLLLAGDAPPEDQLHRVLEDHGASVVVELTGARDPGGAARMDALTALAQEFQRRESPALTMRRDGRWLADTAREQNIDAVVLWLSEEDEALPWEVARQMRALREQGTPTLLLARQPWRLDAAALQAVREFLQTLGSPS